MKIGEIPPDKKINISKGIIVIPKHTKHSLADKKFRIFYSGHPLPDIESVKAGKAVKEFVNNCTKNDFILFLVSGGGSSLPSKLPVIMSNIAFQIMA